MKAGTILALGKMATYAAAIVVLAITGNTPLPYVGAAIAAIAGIGLVALVFSVDGGREYWLASTILTFPADALAAVAGLSTIFGIYGDVDTFTTLVLMSWLAMVILIDTTALLRFVKECL